MALVFVLCIALLLTCVIRNIDKWHLERIPFFGPCFLLGVLDKHICVRADLCPITPITWDMLDETPEGFPDDEWWFYNLPPYTRLQLKRYMQENDLYILPKEYELVMNMSIDRVLEELEFGKLSDLEKP